MILRYGTEHCGSCGRAFTPDDDIVVCPRCGTPEHKECWAGNGDCVNAYRHGEGFVWQAGGEAPAESLTGEEPLTGGDGAAGRENAPAAGIPGAANVCRNCGAANEVGEPVCLNCGERLYLSGVTPGAAGGYYPGSSGQYGRYGADANTAAEIDGVPAAEVAAYVRQNPLYYLHKFTEMDRRGKTALWNWAAFISPHCWLFYRKMYKLGAVVAAIILLSTYTYNAFGLSHPYGEISARLYNSEISYEEAVDEISAIPPRYWAITAVTLAVELTVRIYMALNANAFYRKKMNGDIREIRIQARDSGEYFSLLSKKGGASMSALILLFAANYALNTFVYALIERLLF